MLTDLSVGSFKAFDDKQSLQLSPITLLFGENSAGKSSFIQALLLLRQSFTAGPFYAEEHPLQFRGSLIDLGSFGAAVRDHDKSRKIELSFTTDNSYFLRGNPFSGKELTWRIAVAQIADTSDADLVDCELKSAEFRARFSRQVKAGTPDLFVHDSASVQAILKLWQENLGDSSPVQPGDLQSEDLQWMGTWLQKTPVSRVGFLCAWQPEELRRGRPGRPIGGSLDSPRRRALQSFVLDWQFWVNTLQSLLRAHLSRIRYIGPLRRAPLRMTMETLGHGGDLDPTGEGAVRILSENPVALRQLNNSLTELQIPYEVVVQSLNPGPSDQDLGAVSVLYLRHRTSGVVLTLADVGVGISQVLPVLIELATAKNVTLLLEQPELHLHPRLQSRLADVIAASANRERRNRILVETHSEHILLRLQRRIREGVLAADEVRVCYVGTTDGGSVVTNIALDEQGGMLDPWPSGFFDDSIEDILASAAERK